MKSKFVLLAGLLMSVLFAQAQNPPAPSNPLPPEIECTYSPADTLAYTQCNTTCWQECGSCSIYFYCGNEMEDSECIIYVICPDSSFVVVADTMGVMLNQKVAYFGSYQSTKLDAGSTFGYSGGVNFSIAAPPGYNSCTATYVYICN